LLRVFVTQKSHSRRALLVGADLMARARLEQAAGDAGLSVATAPPERLHDALRAHEPDVVILDLDAGGRELLDRLEEARTGGALRGRVVGYFSHVDADLGAAARAAGCEALPRGRFWRALPEVLAGG
jgi:CheY-like chemotaxis protein